MRTEKSKKKLHSVRKVGGKVWVDGAMSGWCITLQVLGRAGLGEGGGLKIHGPFFPRFDDTTGKV